MNHGLPGWEELYHHGLLLDAARLHALAQDLPPPLDDYTERQLRQRGSAVLDGSGDVSPFVAFVLERVCGFGGAKGTWLRGANVTSAWSRRAVTGEAVKPRHLWQGRHGATLPVFLDDSKHLGRGRGRRIVSQAVGWLRAGSQRLALLSNGRQWRLLFAGLDYDASCEWDLDLWFQEGELAPQVTALRALLRPELWIPEAEAGEPPLLQAIRDTRKGQAELSEVLGEHVREAVEVLIQGHGDELKERCSDVDPADIYRAACRIAMRLVVILFAEARELLPRENALYHESYGLNGLLERLQRDAAHGAGMAQSHSAWPRVLALFRLVWEGSHFPDLPVTQYGGELFAPGGDGADGLARVLAVYEAACFETDAMSDRDVYEVLRLLTQTTVRIRQGRSSIRAAAPVDFSDLSSEYIGVLYEGLLDYELKTAPPGDPVIFLAAGAHPALPLSRLEEMDDRALKALFENLKDTSKANDADEDESSGDAEAGENLASSQPLDDEAQLEVRDNESSSAPDVSEERQHSRTRAETWARRAAQAAGLVRKPRRKAGIDAFEDQLRAKARQLVSRVVLPREWYLVRWGGTRKGRGTFHTRPGLAIPTVQRTLRPLAFNPPLVKGKRDADAPAASWTPKLPEEILGVTVCDPACGSGTFPLAALRFLTDALYDSLQHYGRIEPDGERALVRLLGFRDEGHAETDSLADELIPCRPDDDEFEPRLKAVLRRHVVERCIYAVDLDPLAVELCRLSLWIETMDRTLPFGFLDHKIKCGNALIGAWFDQFRHYPAMAWKNREGGDKGHGNGVHFKKEERTEALKEFVKEQLTPDLKSFLQGGDLFREDLLQKATTAHDDAMAVLADIHSLPVQNADTRRNVYHERFLGSPEWRSLKNAMDLWCACWFWPADHLDYAPLPTSFAEPAAETRIVAERIAAEMRFFHWELEFPDVFRKEGAGFDAVLGNPPWDIAKPVSKEFFSNVDPLYRSYGKQEALRKQTAYFKDAIVEGGWLDYNARFRAQSKFTSHAASPFGDPEDNDKSGDRFSIVLGNENRELHERWRETRNGTKGFADPAHPFRHQGSADINLYKLFLEAAHSLLKPGGRLGFVVPSGLYSDNGTGALRRLFVEHCRWEWLFGIENREKIFPIDSRLKFNPVIVEKGESTEAIHTVFMRRKLHDWERAEELATPYTREQIERFSPRSRAILEIQSKRDLEILEKIYANSVLLGDDGPDGWGIRYATEFHMTNDSHLFPPRPQWEAKGYRPDEYSRWLLGDWRPIEELWEELGVDPSQPEPVEIELEDWLFDTTAGPERREAEARFVHEHWMKPGDVAKTESSIRCARPPYNRLPVPRDKIPPGVILAREATAWLRESRVEDMALPLYEGRMIGLVDFSEKGWVRGKGRQAVWRDIPWNHKQIEPQYLMAQKEYSSSRKAQRTSKIAYMRVSSSTNSRTAIATYLGRVPAGDSVFYFVPQHEPELVAIVVSSIFATFSFDSVIRRRLGGLNMSEFVLNEATLPPRNPAMVQTIVDLAAEVNLVGPLFSCERIHLGLGSTVQALQCARRLERKCTIDALVALWMGLDIDDLLFLFSDCDASALSTLNTDPKGFWRIDRDKDPELRQTVLTLVAFHDLEAKIKAADGDREKGIEAFLTQNHGEGWGLPDTLRLSDYRLGHDDRAEQPQPVASCLGARFYDWQLVQSPDESWRECHIHARNLLGAQGYAILLVDLIERRVAEGEDYLDLLTDSFVHGLTDRDGYVTILFEILFRKVLYDNAYWNLVTDLRNRGCLDPDGCGQLIDRLHARKLIDDLEYRRWTGREASAPASELLPRVAEPESDYNANPRQRDEQKDLFK